MTGYAIKMTILITAMTVCIGLNTERVIGHQTGHPRVSPPPTFVIIFRGALVKHEDSSIFYVNLY